MYLNRKWITLILITLSFSATAQISVDNTITPEDVVNMLVGEGILVSNISYEGDLNQFGSFENTGDQMGIANGVILATGDCVVAIGPNSSGSMSQGGGNSSSNSSLPGDPGDIDLEAISGVNTNDNAVLEFDFVPAGDSLKFFYVFGSEEYDDYECCSVNDAFGFFVSGPGITGPYSSPAGFPDGSINIARVPGTDIGVSINTVNSA
ncbi:MAG: choice-of-anchor L domain-containing protein, partial [Flavobacteriales bacterium]|nr:choice-of-anchor L domain-containing protein [Flavobacteriales bacterium]